MKFNVHFFKEKTRKLDIDAVFDFFDRYGNMKADSNNGVITFVFNDSSLKLSANFYITPKSVVPDIHRLDPRYLDLNFRVELDPFLATFKVEVVFDIIEDLCKEFNMQIYNELFDNVLLYRKELLVTVYEIIKRAHKEKSVIEYESLYYMSKEKLNQVLKYQKENHEIQTYYKNEDLLVPRYIFLKNHLANEVKCSIEWVADTNTVFPPNLDFIFYRNSHVVYLYSYDEVAKAISKYFTEVPGFVKNTKRINKNNLKKVFKIMSKNKFRQLEDTFERIGVESIIDV